MNKIIKNRLRILVENSELTNRILDKISASGMNSLTSAEKNYLNNQSAGVEDKETEDLVSIEPGHVFDKNINMSALNNATETELKFEYKSTSDYDEYLIHRGVLFVDGYAYLIEIMCNAKPNLEYSQYLLFDMKTTQKINVTNETADKELDEFFEEIGNKINQTLK
jgi:hypothetical protein